MSRRLSWGATEQATACSVFVSQLALFFTSRKRGSIFSFQCSLRGCNCPGAVNALQCSSVSEQTACSLRVSSLTIVFVEKARLHVTALWDLLFSPPTLGEIDASAVKQSVKHV